MVLQFIFIGFKGYLNEVGGKHTGKFVHEKRGLKGI